MQDLRSEVEPVLSVCSECSKLKSCRSYLRSEVERSLRHCFGRPSAVTAEGDVSHGFWRYFCGECVGRIT